MWKATIMYTHCYCVELRDNFMLIGFKNFMANSELYWRYYWPFHNSHTVPELQTLNRPRNYSQHDNSFLLCLEVPVTHRLMIFIDNFMARVVNYPQRLSTVILSVILRTLEKDSVTLHKRREDFRKNLFIRDFSYIYNFGICFIVRNRLYDEKNVEIRPIVEF